MLCDAYPGVGGGAAAGDDEVVFGFAAFALGAEGEAAGEGGETGEDEGFVGLVKSQCVFIHLYVYG